METIETTVAANYVIGWRKIDGVRELLQNALDARQDGDEIKIQYDPLQKQLSIQNEGSVLTRKVLLLGFTNKMDRKDQIGQFGEGLKLAALVLARNKCAVEIRTGTESWVPEIVSSKKFDGEAVLTFQIRDDLEYFKGVRATISGLELKDWEEIQQLILPAERWTFKTGDNEVLLLEQYSGKVYVGGILVNGSSQTVMGYNFSPGSAKLDRDRKMIESFNMREMTQYLIEEWTTKGDGVEKSVNLLKSDAEDVVHSKHAFLVGEAFAKKVKEHFLKAHGDDAFPACSTHDIEQARFVGKNPVVVSKTYATVLIKSMGDLEAALRDKKHQPKKMYPLDELTDEERGVYNLGLSLLNRNGVDTPPVMIVDFNDAGLLGLYTGTSIFIARKQMESRGKFIVTLVHEVAHKHGGDGTASHEHRSLEILEHAINDLLKTTENRMEAVRTEKDKPLELRV